MPASPIQAGAFSMNENEVIAALKLYLSCRGYDLVSECSTTSRGIDLVMVNKMAGREIRIEAKGSTSAREGSSRYGKQFNDAQCHDHFSRALFKACQMRDEALVRNESVLIGIAFAHTKHYQKYSDRSAKSIKALGIGLFWVGLDGKVTAPDNWEH